MTPSIAVRCAVLATCVVMTGCAGGFHLAKVDTDRSIITGSVQPAPTASRPKSGGEGQLDEIAIRNAVTSADLDAAPTLAWENPETGSRGIISEIQETRESRFPCRSFRASRHAFDGILLYEGKACLAGQGNWQMRQYQPVGDSD